MERGGCGYGPYFDPDFDSFTERINPPRVCVDNRTCEDCTLIQVDSANKHGILLEMVQVLTDLDLVISKSYISSDGRWFMDVFHVTDQLGNKVTDPALIHCIEQSLVVSSGRTRRPTATPEVRTCLGKVVCPRQLSEEYTALELTGTDRRGFLSEISAVLAELGCHVASAQAWSDNSRVAMILYLAQQQTTEDSSNRARIASVQEQVEGVVRAHHEEGERWSVRLVGPARWVHAERRLHQMMHEDREYEEKRLMLMEDGGVRMRCASSGKIETQVSIECCREKGYSVVNIRSMDRPKLLFDTVCSLTDMDYVVFHATVRSHGPLAIQEYFIRRMDGCTLDSESEKRSVSRCLVAAIERRPSHGMGVNVCTGNRTGLLSDVTRVFREHGLSLTKAEIGTRGERAIGTFFLTDASGMEAVAPETVESVRREIGGTVTLEVDGSIPARSSSRTRATAVPGGCGSKSAGSGSVEEQRPGFSLGSLIWFGIERFSNNFGSIRS